MSLDLLHLLESVVFKHSFIPRVYFDISLALLLRHVIVLCPYIDANIFLARVAISNLVNILCFAVPCALLHHALSILRTPDYFHLEDRLDCGLMPHFLIICSRNELL